MAWTLVLLVALGLVIVVSATLGAARIPVHITADVLLVAAGVPSPWSSEATETQQQIVLAIRLPRILSAALVGAALGLVGMVMQSIFRNPMADPGIVGVSAGGALGALLAIAYGLAAAGLLVLPGAAFTAHSSLAGLAVFLFSLRRGRNQVATLLLAGIAITYLCSAATTALISLTYNRDTLREMVFWLLGGFDNRSWQHVALVAPAVVLATVVFLLHARSLNLLALGEEDAQSLGVLVHRTRLVLLVAAALATGASVAISGLVGFVGLVVPHFVRLLVGTSDHRVLLPLVALGGAVFLLTADTIARVVVQTGGAACGRYHGVGWRAVLLMATGTLATRRALGLMRFVAWTLAGLLVVVTACSQAPPAPPQVPTPVLGAARSPRQATIVEPRVAAGMFPRQVRDVNGDVIIPAKPQRIHTLSVGYDEITFRLVDLSRVLAVGNATANPEFSNVADEAMRVPARVGRDAEQILALGPDLVVASPFRQSRPVEATARRPHSTRHCRPRLVGGCSGRQHPLPGVPLRRRRAR